MARGIVELHGDEILLRIEGGTERHFAFAEAAEKLKAWSIRYDLALTSARDDGPLIAIGAEMFAWTDGWASEWANQGEGDRELEIRAPADGRQQEIALLDAPWELLAGPNGAFAFDEDRLFIVSRRIGGERKPREPKRSELGLMFMAAEPEGEASLNFEAEEAGILEATKTLSLRLVVEESGALPFLEARLASNEGPFEALHLACHGDIHEKLGPVLILEKPEGGVALATPADLISALGADKPPLAMLSACRTAEFGRAAKDPGFLGHRDEPRRDAGAAKAPDVAAPLARRLVAQVPNVVGWDGSVYDADAVEFARAFYARLAAHHGVPAAAAYARREVKRRARRDFCHWHLARVYLSPAGGGPLTARNKPKRPALAARAFLDSREQVPVATRAEFVGRRRAIQAVLRAFRAGAEGVLIHGMGALGKSSLAARVVSRYSSHTPVVVFARYDAVAMLDAVADALPAAIRVAEKAQWRELARANAANLGLALEAWFDGPLAEKPILLIIDDLERILETPRPGDEKTGVAADYRAVLGAVLRVFARHAPSSRLLLTSRYDFRLSNEFGDDLAKALARVPLRPMDPGERDKQWRAAERAAGREGAEPKGDAKSLLDEALKAAGGNPGLQAVLTKPILSGDLQAAKSALARIDEYLQTGIPPGTLDALVAAGEAGDTDNALTLFFKRLSFSTYAAALSADEKRALSGATLFSPEVPIPCAALAAVASALGVAQPDRAVARLIGLGLLDDWGELRGAPHAAANPLARPLAARLPEADAPRLAAAARPALIAAWRSAKGNFPFDARGVEAARLAVPGGAAPEVIEAAALSGGAWLARVVGDTRPALALVTAAFTALPDGYACGAGFLRLACECADALGQAELLANLLAAPILAAPVENNRAQNDRARLDIRRAEYLRRAGDVAGAEHVARVAAETLKHLADDHGVAFAMGQVADILESRGDLDGALRIRKEELLPVYERLGDVHSRAVTVGKIADILQSLGDLEGALQMHEEQLPVFERLGDVRERAITLGKIGDIVRSCGDLDGALRIHEVQLPVFERLGDALSRALTKGKIADILQLRGDLDGALRIRREEELPVYDRLGDVRARAVTLGKIADILQARGDLNGALRIRQEEQLPTYERLGDARLRAMALFKIATILLADNGFAKGKAQEIADALRESFAINVHLGQPDGVGAVGSTYAQILAMAGYRNDALAVLDHAEAAFAKLRRQSGVDRVRELRDRIRQMPAPNASPPADPSP